ncbi:unnamed protein product, partial [Trichobilharzia regenti]
MLITELDWSDTASGSGYTTRIESSRLPLLSYMSVLRGEGANDQIRDADNFANSLTKNLLICGSSPALVPSPFGPVIRGHPRYFGDYPRSLFVASNGGGPHLGNCSTIDDAYKESLISSALS